VPTTPTDAPTPLPAEPGPPAQHPTEPATPTDAPTPLPAEPGPPAQHPTEPATPTEAPLPAEPSLSAQHPPTGPPRHRLAAACLLVGLLAVAAGALGIGVRSTYGGYAAVDEPQYLLTALSLAEDRSLDISDELADRRFLPYHDADLPVQTQPRPGGRQVSPHDPGLPLLLAGPVRLGGWVAAKATLALLGGLLAALTLWVAVRRFGVPPRIAVPGVALAACSAPLAVYAQQVYPELPAALATMVAVAALTGQLRRWPALAALAAAVVALPWLSVKYVPVAAALAGVGVVRAGRRRAAVLAGVLALAGAGYLVAHRLVWGGWTVYASGDDFTGSGEFGVVGFHPDYPGRSIRLIGLLVDRDFGLAAWQPAWLLVLPAAAALLRARPAGWAALAAPLATGWLSATYLAVTMHGFWWPGRQLVVVLPVAVLVLLRWLTQLRPLWSRLGLAGLALAGTGYYAAVLVAGYRRETTWVAAADRTDLHPPLWRLLPDDRVLSGVDRLELALWTVALLGWVAVVSAGRGRSTGRRTARPPAVSRT
jgi:hypothetical protein